MEKLSRQKMKHSNIFSHQKQNPLHGFRKNSAKLLSSPINSQLSLTQSLFPSKNNSFRNNGHQPSAIFTEFSQTSSSGFTNTWSRPESKHAQRRQSNRPETSKGPRPTPNVHCHLHPQRPYPLTSLTKSSLPCKSVYSQNQGSQQLDVGCDEALHDQEQEQEEYQEFDDMSFKVKNIRIVVNKLEKPRKEKSFHQDRIVTNLPDEFLGLFAD